MPVRALGDLAPADFAAAGSPGGRAWIAALPTVSAQLAREWDLSLTGEPFRRGVNAAVFFVTQSDRPLALKLTWPASQARGEVEALAAWRARGVAGLIAFDLVRGALLLERLNDSRSLATVPLAEAAAAAGALIRTLAIEAPPACPSSRAFPSLQAAASEIAATLPRRQRELRDPVPDQWVTLAARLAAGLARDPARRLVHADLHYGNILASDRPGQRWVAIDPAAAVGAPERSVAELLRTRADEIPGPARLHRPAGGAHRERPAGPGEGGRLGLRAVHRLLALGTGQRADDRPSPVPAGSQRAGTDGRAAQPAIPARLTAGAVLAARAADRGQKLRHVLPSSL